MTDISCKIVINSLFNSIMASALMPQEYTIERRVKDTRESLESLGRQISTILEERDAAIARAEKAEAALEAARIEGCKWGIEAAFDDSCLHLNPAQIVKEREK